MFLHISFNLFSNHVSILSLICISAQTWKHPWFRGTGVNRTTLNVLVNIALSVFIMTVLHMVVVCPFTCFTCLQIIVHLWRCTPRHCTHCQQPFPMTPLPSLRPSIVHSNVRLHVKPMCTSVKNTCQVCWEDYQFDFFLFDFFFFLLLAAFS